MLIWAENLEARLNLVTCLPLGHLVGLDYKSIKHLGWVDLVLTSRAWRLTQGPAGDWQAILGRPKMLGTLK